jgi:hypothetical protein
MMETPTPWHLVGPGHMAKGMVVDEPRMSSALCVI